MRTLQRYIWSLGLATLMVVALSACDSKKNANNAAPTDAEDEELVEADPAADPATEPAAAIDDDEADYDDEEEYEMTAEERERYENEVWPYLGGTYAFGNGDRYYAVEVSLDDNTKCTLHMGEDLTLDGTIDRETGFITATDSVGDVAFKGAVYAGGNLLKGTLYGKPFRAEGLCGL